MPESAIGSSPRFTARMAGFFWLMTIVTGSLALVGDQLIVAGDAAATAANIVAHESSFRLGLAANIVFLPRAVGALMVIAGSGWLTMSLANLLSPPLGHILCPYILAPGAIGEISLSLWLLAMGVNAQRWRERAGAVTA